MSFHAKTLPVGTIMVPLTNETEMLFMLKVAHHVSIHGTPRGVWVSFFEDGVVVHDSISDWFPHRWKRIV